MSSPVRRTALHRAGTRQEDAQLLIMPLRRRQPHGCAGQNAGGLRVPPNLHEIVQVAHARFAGVHYCRRTPRDSSGSYFSLQ